MHVGLTTISMFHLLFFNECQTQKLAIPLEFACIGNIVNVIFSLTLKTKYWMSFRDRTRGNFRLESQRTGQWESRQLFQMKTLNSQMETVQRKKSWPLWERISRFSLNSKNFLFTILLLLLLFVGDSTCFNLWLSRSILLGRPGDLLPTGILSVRINLPLFSTVVPAVVFFCPVGLSLL